MSKIDRAMIRCTWGITIVICLQCTHLIRNHPTFHISSDGVEVGIGDQEFLPGGIPADELDQHLNRALTILSTSESLNGLIGRPLMLESIELPWVVVSYPKWNGEGRHLCTLDMRYTSLYTISEHYINALKEE